MESRTISVRVEERTPAIGERFEWAGMRWEMVDILKEDFASMNWLVRKDGRLYVIKTHRFLPIIKILFRWLEAIMCRREVRLYRRLEGIPGIPRAVAHVGNAFAHEFVVGDTLRARPDVDAEFFDRLIRIVEQVHERGVSYNDLSKRENVLVGDDGRPYLIDFQISTAVSDRPVLGLPWTLMVRRLMAEDTRHVLKHKRALRPDRLTDAEAERVDTPSLINRLHGRFLRTPYLAIKRRLIPKGSL